MITWDRDMVAAIGDYQLRIWPNVSDEWTWYVYLAAPNALHTVAGGSAPDEVAARAAAESALIRRLASYQGLAIAAELARLRRIETAAGEALASGQARYDRNLERLPDTEEFALEGRYVGDLIPAAKMIALAEAVHGATVVDEKPPAASDEYARRLEAALVEGAGDVGVSTPRDALSFARETVTAARAAANRGAPLCPTMTLELVRLSEIGMGLAEAIRSGHCGPEAGSIRCLRAVVDACAEHADDQDDDDGCPHGDPDCDLPADSLHEWCEAPDNEEAINGD